MTQLMSEYLPQVRCSKEMKQKLEEIAAHSLAPRITDHIRFAVDQYIAEQWRPEFAADAGVALEDDEVTVS